MRSRSILIFVVLPAVLLLGCVPAVQVETPTAIPTAGVTVPAPTPIVTLVPSVAPAPSATPVPLVPRFRHIVTIVLENKEFGTVVNNPQMPYFNELANSHTLLTQHFAVAHPSLPNYLALISGETFGVNFDCTKCIQTAPSLPDLIEASGRTWKAYNEDMPSPCFAADAGNYALKHNPFLYFSPIVTDRARCARSDVPLLQLYSDLTAGNLPDYAFITPNLCNDAHDCSITVADDWLKALMLVLLPDLDHDGQPYLVIVTWDEGQGNHSCCDLPAEAGGRIATILISPQARSGFQDSTPYTHYSILKTIAESWGLAYLGHAADPSNVLITAPWKTGP
jgi:hypothetical protein